jgi:hypothetical protein
MEAQALSVEQPFRGALEEFLKLTQELQSPEVQSMRLSPLESLVEVRGREILRSMLEEHIHLRGPGNVGSMIEGSDGIERTHLRERDVKIATIFGDVTIDRLVYGKPGNTSLMPKHAMLNLPARSYSHGLEQRLAMEVAKGSFSEASRSVEVQTGVVVQKRQVEQIAQNVAQDFEAFYREREVDDIRRIVKGNEYLILSTDGKGIVMRKADLREATKKRAEESNHKLQSRLSKGEKKNAKRMAQVAAVYSIDPHDRTPEQVAAGEVEGVAPRPEGKRVWASVARDSSTIVSDMFDEAQRRDPRQCRDWAVLLDGQLYQLGLVEAEIENRQLKAVIVLDIVHVIEYLWRAARDFYCEGSADAEAWVNRYFLMILQGKAKLVAAAIRRSATANRFAKKNRKGVDKCADYLHDNAHIMQYQDYLKRGLPIGTGVIEGACRHLVKDRMDLTGARWSLEGAEAVLRLRSIYASGDWQEYWAFHEEAEYDRNHRIHYAHPERLEKPRLRLVK